VRLHQLALEAGNLGVAAQAIKLKAVLAGEWIEKSDVTRRSADLDTLSDAELLVIARGADNEDALRGRNSRTSTLAEADAPSFRRLCRPRSRTCSWVRTPAVARVRTWTSWYSPGRTPGPLWRPWSPSARTCSRVTAACALLDRGYGRPFQALAIAHGGTGELAQLLAEIDRMSRGLPDPVGGKLLPMRSQ
jgi:hypothetical protein